MTLALLFLGSVVHATGSSLACPDWPTCFGTLTPEMRGGIFWEHLHRVWAAALVVVFAAATAFARREFPERSDLFRLGLVGVGLLLVQSVLGGLAVLYRLPDAISTAHLAMAFAFLWLATVLTVRAAATGTGGDPTGGPGAESDDARRRVRRAGLWTAGLVFLQSIAGALVRHADAGMACPDVPLCLGRIVPPLDHPLVRLHFLHRLLGVLVVVATLALGRIAWTATRDAVVRRMAAALAVGVVAQALLGFASVAFRLAPPYVSTHTLAAAALLATAVAMAARACARFGAPVFARTS